MQRIYRRFALVLAAFLPTVCVYAVNVSIDFEVDAASPFTLGPAPLTSTYTGGSAGVPANPALVLGGTRSWQIPDGTLGVITFEIAPRGVFIQSRTEFPAGGEVRVYNVDGALILARPISDSFSAAQIVVGNGPKIDRVEIDGATGAGLTAVDDIIYIADATPTDMTVLYTRPDNDYAGVTVEVSGELTGGSPQTLVCLPTVDSAFGCQVEFETAQGGAFTYSVSKGGTTDVGPFDLDTDTFVVGDRIYTFSGGTSPIVGELPALPMDDVTVPGPDEVILHYIRPDGIYDGWGLHLWNPAGQDWTNFTGGEYFPEDIDPDLGAVFRIALPQNTFPAYSASPVPEPTFPEPLGLIIHRGPEKDPGPDQFINISTVGNMIFVQSGINQIFSAPPDPDAIQIAGAGAHWMTSNTLVWNPLGSPDAVALLVSDSASITVNGSLLSGEDAMYMLTPGTNPNLANAQHLAAQPAWTLPPEAVANAASLLRGQLIAVALDAQGNQIEATEVQIPFVLDDLYAAQAADADLGATFDGTTPTLSVWAPTARAVTANIYDLPDDSVPSSNVPLVYDAVTGVWSVTGDTSWNRKYYTYTVSVYTPGAGGIIDNVTTDPYSLNVSLGSSANRLAKTQIINLDDADLKPAGWDTLIKPTLDAPEDIVVYELHVRDFSVNDMSVPANERGKFVAFDRAGSAGRNHLEALADAGLTHVHLLPSFDIATVNEARSERVETDDPVEVLCSAVPDAAALCTSFPGQLIEDVLAAQPGNSDLQQQIIEWMRDLDGFNWGYDPYHFTVPEGSYATNPDDASRVLEFRRMVKALADEDLRLVMDVVYNHTNASGFLASTSVFDKIVPGYYHRLGQSSGIVLGDSCCQDTASEHAMMDKFMVDSVVTWAREYKVDGFRYDLMGFHPKSTMEKSRDALQALTLNDDGVDGSAIYLYGEGWNFGDIANDRRFEQATQANMAGTGIGTFNDRLRDGVRGGGPFDSGITHRLNQGFASGLFYDPNSFNSGSAGELNTLLQRTDWARIGMTGNLANYPLQTANGTTQLGSQINYNGQVTGYTLDPQETINYVGKHDNETLWDVSVYKHPEGTSSADRARAHVVASSTVLLGQGVPFIHAGQDLLRSKSMDRDSFDSGDWFNKLDFTLNDNNFGVGEPRNSTNAGSLSEIQNVLTIPTADAAPADIALSAAQFRDLLAVRASTRLFRLPTELEVVDRVSFHNTGVGQLPGVIVQRIDGCVSPSLTPETGAVVTVINARPEVISLPLFQSEDFSLHPVLASSADAVVRTADHTAQGFTVPARTTAVFVAAQQYACATDDVDADSVSDGSDNCVFAANASQLDSNGDGIGNACDADLDNNCVVNVVDLGLLRAAFFSTPGAGNWNPDADLTGDGVVNVLDLARLRARFFQNYTDANPSGIANDCAQ